MNMFAAAFRYLRRYPGLSSCALVSMIGASLFEGMSYGMLIPLIQSMMNANSAGSGVFTLLERFMPSGIPLAREKAVAIIFILIFIVVCLKNSFLYVSTMLITRLRLTVTRDLSSSLVDRLIGYDIAYFDKAKTGHLLAQIDAETNRIGTFVQAILHFAMLSIRVTAYVVVLFIISWKASIALFILIGVVLMPLEVIMKRLAVFSGKYSTAIGDFNFKIIEILSGIRLIKERGTEDEERANFRNVANEMFRCVYRLNQHTNVLIPISETVIFGVITLSFVVLLHFVHFDIAALFPFVAAYLVILVKMLSQLNQLNGMRSMVLSNIAAIKNYEDAFDDRGKRTIISGTAPVRALSDSIVFKDVHFHYEEHKSVFRGVSLTIKQGKRVAIVGSSGAGKSTLVNLIMRFYDPVKGRITVDGVDLRELDIRAWRRSIGFVSQNFFLFNTSVSNNIAYGITGKTDEQIKRAAVIANADEFIQRLPKKYDTIIGERGVQLSGGQRQRLSIARAIIENPDILILDEATSSLDSETEAMINDALEKVMAKRTVVAIAHRLSTVINADSIIVLDGGAVAAEGTNDELLKKSDIYRKLYETQFGK